MTQTRVMTTCEHCARHAQADDESVGAADNARFGRLVLAALNGAPDAVALIAGETGGCADCAMRLAGAGLGMSVAQIAMIGMVKAVNQHAAENPSAAPMTDDEKWAAAHQYAIAAMEQIVADAVDLETGL